MGENGEPRRVHIALVRACAYGWWRTIAMVVKALGPRVFQGEEWVEVGRGVGLREGLGLRQLVPPQLSGVERLVEALKHSHWAMLEDVEISSRNGEVELVVYGCSARQALARWRAESYDCSLLTKPALEGVAEGLGLKVRVELLRKPGLAGRGEESCRWRLIVEGGASRG